MIKGLTYHPRWVSPEEEAELVSVIDAELWSVDLKRRTQHYGYKYDYTKKSVDVSMSLGPLPQWLEPLTTRLVESKVFSQPIDQVIVNEYLPGQGIGKHIDCVPCFGDPVASLSLSAPCMMEFEHPKTGVVRAWLEPCSLVVLRGEARYDWTHGIEPRKSDVFGDAIVPRTRRISLTFRTVIKG